MRRAGITQKDIDKARKSQEVSLIEHCKQLRYVLKMKLSINTVKFH